MASLEEVFPNFTKRKKVPKFITYLVKCVYCGEEKNISPSYDGCKHQKCGKCNKEFYAPDFYDEDMNLLK